MLIALTFDENLFSISVFLSTVPHIIIIKEAILLMIIMYYSITVTNYI